MEQAEDARPGKPVLLLKEDVWVSKSGVEETLKFIWLPDRAPCACKNARDLIDVWWVFHKNYYIWYDDWCNWTCYLLEIVTGECCLRVNVGMGQWPKIIPRHYLSDGNDKLRSMKYPGEETWNPVAVQSQLIHILLIVEKSILFERTRPVNPSIILPLSIRNICSTTNITCIIIQIYLASEIVPRMN